MHARPWSWLAARVTGLLSTPPAGFVEVSEGRTTRLHPHWRTRLQHDLYPPGR